MRNSGRIAESRRLTADEHRVLRWLLTVGAEITGTDSARAAAYLPQLDEIRVTGRCNCGCPSIDLAIESPQLLANDGSCTLSDVGLILRAESGRLSTLEAYARDGIVPFSLPTDEQLAAFG